jgi:hypothetical protein
MALATHHLTAGTATFGLALSEGQAISGVQVGALNTQTDIKTTWNDGSIRFCVVSCVVPVEADYDITAGPATSGSFTPTWPSASVAFVIGATTWTATLPSLTTSDPWLVGPHVKEYRVKTVPMDGATPHPILDVWFDVRSYQTGGHRVDIQVSNMKDDANNNSVTYDVTATIAGSGVFSESAKLQKTMTRWRRAFTTGSPTLSTVTYDLGPYHVSYAIPRYAPGIAAETWPSSDTLAHARYDILSYGDMSEGMASPGGRPELAPYPRWCADWLTNQEADSYAYMIRSAELSGSWCNHVTNPDHSSITRDDEPTYWLDAANRGGSMSIPGDPENFGFLVGIGEGLEINHIPQLCLIPYVVTGDRFFIDQMKLWAHACILMEYMGDGWHTYGVDGITPMRTLLYTHQIRGIAWGLRTIAEAAAFLPDSDDDKAYFVNAVFENLTFLDWVATTLDPGGPLGIPFVTAATGGATAALAMVPWQCDYVAYAIDRCHALGIATSLGQDMQAQLATWRVAMLTNSAGWNRESGASYWVPNPPDEPGIGSQSAVGLTPAQEGGPTIPAGVGRVWKTMAEIYTDNFAGDGENVTGPYGGEALIGLRIAIQLGITGAQTAYDYLEPLANPVHSGWELIGVNGTETQPDIPTYIRRQRIRFRA